ncbi:DNA topoisomerase IB [Amycolatopsis acidiphila]|uniref:DNA topoisomerase n=1 Tax=Amycolatopsis acidiphila TaxID=715473 RepID=A0A558A7G7_9PSEU|nr:DNA topoisomerase IB [Amycolatopsis acidiphila]TVT20209.1 DNA topoisomerase IB [Amycolatopsis acidiphila]UIJ58242.1 DNA topoisomerase IB [Amycolatopsis acidiphila]GHG69222.1 DNA topoisomerase [Amycolatopsis acidiphila]
MRLARSDLSAPGIRRRKSGKGFRYFTPEGEPLRDAETLERVQDLVIPPAWRKVWISPRPNGHIQAVGVDDAGRKQYLYHEQWRRERDEQKHDRVLRLAKCLPKWREQVAADLHERGLTKTRVLGAALRMLDRGVFRTGSEEYAEANGTRGAATLLKDDVRVRGNEITFCYNAKGSIERTHSITDEELAKVIKALLRADSGSDRLLVYRDSAGWHEVHADQINERFKEISGDEFTGKDLRTWHATVLAAAAFAAAGPVKSKRGLQRTQAAVMREVAESLGNTPAVAKRSYVDPRVVHAYEEGSTVESALRRLGAKGVRGDQERQVLERAVIRLLSKRSHV